jgi:superfamily I DNA/RNA helicase
MLTDEQSAYVYFKDNVCTKLLATAGSGKTHTIIKKLEYLISEKIFKENEILMLTFSRFTRDDFINRIKKYNIQTISLDCIKTIDSFAKTIIDPNNEIDVSILSYTFMIYLEESSSKKIRSNKNLKNIKAIFVDEAQDLNYTQYRILMLLNEKNKTTIHLIGDPNQNIFQFRGSSDKYLIEFNAKKFYLTNNFRSHKEIVNFSKYLRPEQDTNINCKLGKTNNLPVAVFYSDEDDLELNIINLLKKAISAGIDLSEFAILSPTRGKMRSNGGSDGLCLISNVLYKNNIKFKQFYEETTDEISNNIQYTPEKGHINILTYMGSKGLEWKYTIILDAEICLINKRNFTEEKHKHDQYLLYVACSRAITNLFIFSKCYFNKKQNRHVLNLIHGFQ